MHTRALLESISPPDPFCYTEGAAIWAGSAEVVLVPPDADEKAEVLAAFSEQLRFPRGFRPTWADLELTLRDLSWVSAPVVVVLHTAVPRLSPSALEIYLDVLQSAALLPNPGSPRLLCVFPAETRAMVGALVRGE